MKKVVQQLAPKSNYNIQQYDDCTIYEEEFLRFLGGKIKKNSDKQVIQEDLAVCGFFTRILPLYARIVITLLREKLYLIRGYIHSSHSYLLFEILFFGAIFLNFKFCKYILLYDSFKFKILSSKSIDK